MPINFGETKGDSKGFYSPTENSITIKEGMSDVQTIKTMIHEIAHSKLHNPEAMKEGDAKSRGLIEQEAESVAYVVCQHFGIETSEYSFAYIAGWAEGKETNELKQSLETIRDTAGEMINRVEGSLRAMEHEREAKIEAEKGNIPMEPPVEPKLTEKDVALPEETKVEAKKPLEKTDNKESKSSDKKERKSIKEKLSEKKKEVAKEKKEKTQSKDLKKGGPR